METFGGYKVKDFTVIAEPDYRDPFKDIYRGEIRAPAVINKEDGDWVRFDVYWNKDGKVRNQVRYDCNISTDDIEKLLLRRARAKTKK